MSWRFALCSEVFKTPLEATIEHIAELGFDGIEIAPFHAAASVDDVSPAQRLALKSAAAAAGIDIVGLHWLLVSPSLELHLTTADDGLRGRTTRYLESLAGFCADIGGKVMVFGSPKQRSTAPGEDRRAAFDRAVEALKPVGRTCGALGVQFLLEPLAPTETNFLNTVEEALELADAIGSPAIGYILDCKAMASMPGGIVETLRRHGGRAGHFHANEPSGKGPGMGGLEFAPILDALGSSGYAGWVSSEPFDYSPDPDTVARTALATLRRAALTVHRGLLQ